MTEIFFPDVSNIGNKGLKLQPNTVAVIAKATEGSSFTDPSYLDFKAQAKAIGAYFQAYHWCWCTNIAAEAAHMLSVIGPNTNVMLDWENPKTHIPTVSDIASLITAYRGLGGCTRLIYLPHWYWVNDLKSPDLTPLVNLGMRFVSSNYTTYSPNGPGWASYGGATPYQWQYTDAFSYGGQRVDFNAVRDTLDNYIANTSPQGVDPVTDPAVPAVIQASEGVGWALLKWNAVPDAVLYEVQVRPWGASDWLHAIRLVDSGYRAPLTNRASGYYWRVAAVNADGTLSDWSNVVTTYPQV